MASQKEESGSEKPSLYRAVNGVNIPAFFEQSVERPLEEHVQLVKAMDMRPDDVIIGAFAKAGTHWMWEVIRMMMNGKAEYDKRIKEFSMLEASPMEQLLSLPSPRLLNSHLPPSVLPGQVKEKGVKVIHLYRNCKDVLVSAYFHFRQVQDVSVDDVAATIIGPGVPGGDYFSYMKEMDDYRKDNPDVPFFTMSFEDIKEDSEKVLKDLGVFLGVETSPELIRDIVEATSITKLREANKTKQQMETLPVSEFYRKGQVGDWKNTLTVAQSERLDAAMKQLESCDYNFRYTL